MQSFQSYWRLEITDTRRESCIRERRAPSTLIQTFPAPQTGCRIGNRSDLFHFLLISFSRLVVDGDKPLKHEHPRHGSMAGGSTRIQRNRILASGNLKSVNLRGLRPVERNARLRLLYRAYPDSKR